MPEGHTVHRTALEFTKNFVGQAIAVSSPQGRFQQAGEILSGRKLVNAFAVGKQLFLEFEGDQTVRIHLGIYGKWRFENFEDFPPAPLGQVRARFVAESRFADLRGPTVCELIVGEGVQEVLAQLGPDPLAPNSDRELDRFVAKVQKSRSAIALLLMNQKVISGVGNVYRAELLFRAKLDPFALGVELTREQLVSLWDDAVKLMRVGVKKGVMVTRDEHLSGKLPLKVDRNHVYKREGFPCRICGAEVKMQLLASRKLYWCPGCQG